MEKKKIFNWIVNILLLVLVATFIVKYNKDKDKGAYDFCVEWNNDILREELAIQCYDFNNRIPRCHWQIIGYGIEGAQTLVVFDYNNSSDYTTYPCTKLAKTIDIEIPITDLEDIEFEDIV